MLIGHYFGSKIIFIESGARVYNASKTGEFIYKYADQFFVHFNLFSFDRILFDVDPIDNNQILLNNYNPDILDTLSYKSRR